MNIPSLSAFQDFHNSYQQYVSLCLFVGLLFAVGFNRFHGRGLHLRFRLWHIILVALVVRLPLMFQNYWYDETFTSTLVSASWLDMFTAISGDVHPPLYYAFVKAFTTVLGHSDFVMRLPALLSGLHIVWGVYLLGKDHGGEQVGRWSALIVALLPAMSYYSSEARYPMFLGATLLFSYLSIREQQYKSASFGLAIASWSHVNGWFYVGVMLVYLFWTSRKLWTVALPTFAIGVWLPFALNQSGDVIDGFWLQQSNPLRFLVDMSITTRFSDWSLNVVMLIVAVVMAILFIALWRWRSQVNGWWLALVVIPPSLQWFVGLVWHPIYLERTMIFSMLLLVVPVAWYLSKQGSRIIVGLALISILSGLGSLYTGDRSNMDDVITECEGRKVYAVNTYTAVHASHYTDADVMVYEDSNSTAQQLPMEARKALWDVVALDELDNDTCLLAQVDAYTKPEQLEHIQYLSIAPMIIEINRHAYWVVGK